MIASDDNGLEFTSYRFRLLKLEQQVHTTIGIVDVIHANADRSKVAIEMFGVGSWFRTMESLDPNNYFLVVKGGCRFGLAVSDSCLTKMRNFLPYHLFWNVIQRDKQKVPFIRPFNDI